MRAAGLIACVLACSAASAQGVVEVAPGEGATFRSSDGEFAVRLRGRFQARVTSQLDEAQNGSSEKAGVGVRRARLVLDGNLTPNWNYYIQLSFSAQEQEADLVNVLRDAYGTWTGLRDLNVRFGQMKVPFSRQRVTSSSALQMVDRSIVTAELNLDRDVGVQLRSDDLFGQGNRLSYQLFLMGGDGRNRTRGDLGLLYGARLQASPLGAFDDVSEGDLERRYDPRWAMAAAVSVNSRTARQLSTLGQTLETGSLTYLHATTDFHFKWRGFSLLTEVLARVARREVLNADPAVEPEYARSAWGAFAQAGYMLSSRWELAARYGELVPFSGTDPSLTRRREAGLGINFYQLGHNLKIQADGFYLPGARWSSGTRQVRLQAQVFF